MEGQIVTAERKDKFLGTVTIESQLNRYVKLELASNPDGTPCLYVAQVDESYSGELRVNDTIRSITFGLKKQNYGTLKSLLTLSKKQLSAKSTVAKLRAEECAVYLKFHVESQNFDELGIEFDNELMRKQGKFIVTNLKDYGEASQQTDLQCQDEIIRLGDMPIADQMGNAKSYKNAIKNINEALLQHLKQKGDNKFFIECLRGYSHPVEHQSDSQDQIQEKLVTGQVVSHTRLPRSSVPATISKPEYARESAFHEFQIHVQPHSQIQHLDTPPHSQSQHLNTPPHSQSQHLDTPPHSQSQHLDTPPHSQSQHLDTPPHSQSQHLDTPPHSQSQHLDTLPHSKSQHVDAQPYIQSQHIDVQPHSQSYLMDTLLHSQSQHEDTLPFGQSQHRGTLPLGQSQHVDAQPHSQIQHVDAQPHSQSQHVDVQPHSQSQHVDVKPHNQSQLMDTLLNSQSQLGDTLPLDQSQHADNVPQSSRQQGDTQPHIHSQHEDSLSHSQSQHEDSLSHSQSQHEDSLFHSQSQHEDSLSHSQSQHRDTQHYDQRDQLSIESKRRKCQSPV